MRAEPIPAHELCQYEPEDVLSIDGKPYWIDDLHQCAECKKHFVHACDVMRLGDEQFCDDCFEKVEEGIAREKEYEAGARFHYNWGRL